ITRPSPSVTGERPTRLYTCRHRCRLARTHRAPSTHVRNRENVCHALGTPGGPGKAERAVTVYRDTLTEGFSHFVTSIAAPVASGWSGCRVGLAPTGERRLCTAHTQGGTRCRKAQ